MVVVLPAPLGPRKPQIFPFSTRKEMSLTASTLANFLERCSTWIIRPPYIRSGISIPRTEQEFFDLVLENQHQPQAQGAHRRVFFGQHREQVVIVVEFLAQPVGVCRQRGESHGSARAYSTWISSSDRCRIISQYSSFSLSARSARLAVAAAASRSAAAAFFRMLFRRTTVYCR